MNPYVIAGAVVAGGLIVAHLALRFAAHPCPGFRISSHYGPRIDPITKNTIAFHRGIDFAVPEGTPLVAPCDGVIDAAAPFGTGGPDGVFIRVRRDDGVSPSFSHCSRLLVQKGEKVTAGQVIAESGNTGRSTGPHLHFAVRAGGQLVNPTLYLPFGGGKIA